MRALGRGISTLHGVLLDLEPLPQIDEPSRVSAFASTRRDMHEYSSRNQPRIFWLG
jgi:hypothetical protein